MKKWILTAACIAAFSGFAAAQKSPAPAPVKKSEQKVVKKTPDNRKATLKQATPVKDTTAQEVKILLPVFPIDTVTTVPKTKDEL
ncbi:MAG TPA: hypothetical protein VFZ78_05875 [Flavisolibacter sp.]